MRILLGSVDARKRLMDLVRLEELSEIVRHESAALIRADDERLESAMEAASTGTAPLAVLMVNFGASLVMV